MSLHEVEAYQNSRAGSQKWREWPPPGQCTPSPGQGAAGAPAAAAGWADSTPPASSKAPPCNAQHACVTLHEPNLVSSALLAGISLGLTSDYGILTISLAPFLKAQLDMTREVCSGQLVLMLKYVRVCISEVTGAIAQVHPHETCCVKISHMICFLSCMKKPSICTWMTDTRTFICY